MVAHNVIVLSSPKQGQNLNGSGQLYLQKYPKLGVKLVDGTSLAAAVIANSIPQGTYQVVLAGDISKVARAVAQALCRKNIKVRSKYSDMLLKKEQICFATKKKKRNQIPFILITWRDDTFLYKQLKSNSPVQVTMTNTQDYHFLKAKIPEDAAGNLSLLSKTGTAKVRRKLCM